MYRVIGSMITVGLAAAVSEVQILSDLMMTSMT